MLDYLPLVWGAIIVLSIVCEAVSHTFIPLWFAPAAFVSLMFSFADIPEWIDIAIFFVITVILLILSRTAFSSVLGIKKCRVQSVVDRQAIVIVDLDNLRNSGKIRIDGVEMTAMSHSDDVVLRAGEIVTVITYKNGTPVCK